MHQVWLKLAQWFWRRLQNFVNVFSLFHYYLPLIQRCFVLISSVYFRYFAIISPWKNVNKLESPFSKRCFEPIGPVVLYKKSFKFRQMNTFSLFPYYVPFQKSMELPVKKLESPSPKDAFCQVWLKLVLWLCRR